MPLDRRPLREELQRTRSSGYGSQSQEEEPPQRSRSQPSNALGQSKPSNAAPGSSGSLAGQRSARRKYGKYSDQISKKGKSKGSGKASGKGKSKTKGKGGGDSKEATDADVSKERIDADVSQEAPPVQASAPTREERAARLAEHFVSPAVQLQIPGQVQEEPARLSEEDVKRVFMENVPGVDKFLYRFQHGNFSMKYLLQAYESGVFKFRGTDLEDHFTWLMRIVVHYADEGKPGCRGYLQEIAEAFMDCQDIQARAIEHVGFQICGLTADFRGLLVHTVDEYKAMAMKFLVTTEIDSRGGPDDWANDPVHFENRIVADIGEALGLNAGDIRRALLDEHKERNRPFREDQRQDLMNKFKVFFEFDLLLRSVVNEINSFSENSPKDSMAKLFLDWVTERMPEKHIVFDEETFTRVEINDAFVLATLEAVFFGETKSQEDFRGKPLCELLPPAK